MSNSHPQPSHSMTRELDGHHNTIFSPSQSQELSYSDGAPLPQLDEATHIPGGTAIRVWAKMDCMVLPVVTAIFFLCFLDRGNIGNARIAGLQKDLMMSDYQYSLALTITFIPYILIELPSNLWLKRIGPNIVLPLMTVLWGIATTLQGTVTSYGGLIACRFFIGLFEGGLSPGCMLYLSSFYPRHQLQLRISIYFTAPTIAGAFSGLLASAILNMDGIGAKPGWAWVFILEGLVTVLFGVLAFFILPRTPSHVAFLSPSEKAYVIRVLHEENSRLAASSYSSDNEKSEAGNQSFAPKSLASEGQYKSRIRWRDVGRSLKLPHVWFIALIAGFFNGATLSGLTYFTPSIVASVGYKANRAQLMSVPPFAASIVLAITSSYYADKYAKRGLTIIAFALLGVAGFGIFLGSHHPRARYASLFLILPGTYAMAPPLAAWTSNNSHTPYATRATSIALITCSTNAGGIFSTWLLGSLSKPPGYASAAWVLGMFQVGIAVCAAMCWWVLWRYNTLNGKRYVM